MKAIVDRLEGNVAVVLFGDKEVRIDISLDELPEGSKEGTWLKLNFEIDQEGEDIQREKISNLLDKLKNKGMR